MDCKKSIIIIKYKANLLFFSPKYKMNNIKIEES